MKLKFKNQAFQIDAVNAVADLFAGQENNNTTFSIVEEKQSSMFNMGVGNALLLDIAALLKNMQEVQKRNNLPLTSDLNGNNFVWKWKREPAKHTSIQKRFLS